MRKKRLLIGASLALAALPLAAAAHHSFAMFDRGRTDTIVGTVKALELVNPHAWLRVMVSGPQGRPEEWSMEMGGPGQLERNGWTATSVQPGDKVSVMIHPLRDGSYGGQLVSVTLPNGKVLGERQPPRND
jgi:hypothetical protein